MSLDHTLLFIDELSDTETENLNLNYSLKSNSWHKHSRLNYWWITNWLIKRRLPVWSGRTRTPGPPWFRFCEDTAHTRLHSKIWHFKIRSPIHRDIYLDTRACWNHQTDSKNILPHLFYLTSSINSAHVHDELWFVSVLCCSLNHSNGRM